MTFWYITAALLLIYIFIPRFGLLALYRDWRATRQREQVEDALKHLLDREQGGRHASPESLAGTLDLRRVNDCAHRLDGIPGAGRITRLRAAPDR